MSAGVTVPPQDTDRELKAWARRVTQGVSDSAVFCNLWHETMRSDPFADPRPLIQLGYAMLLDKPIVVLLPRGAELPEHLARAADRIIPFDPDAPGGLERATEALAAFVKAHGEGA